MSSFTIYLPNRVPGTNRLSSGKPISHWTDTLLHRLCRVRNSLQHCLEEDHTTNLASNSYPSMGYCRNAAGCGSELPRVPRFPDLYVSEISGFIEEEQLLTGLM